MTTRIYVLVDTRYVEEGETETEYQFGPYTEVRKGMYGDLVGIKDDGAEEPFMEITTGAGGYCDTCEYSYVSFVLPNPITGNLDGRNEHEGVAFRFVLRDE